MSTRNVHQDLISFFYDGDDHNNAADTKSEVNIFIGF